MQYIIIIAVVGAAALVLYSLARGLYYFAQTRDGIDGTGPSEAHLMQNRMMFQRIKWQAITVILLILLGLIAGTR